MAEPPKGVSANTRLRMSAWADPTIFMNGTRDGKGIFHPVQFKTLDDLFKKDALVDVAIVNGKTVIDDISLLVTVLDDNTANLKLRWDPMMLQGTSDALRQQFYERVIDHCHHVLGTQCLIGFDRKDLSPKTPPKPPGAKDGDPPPPKVEPALARWFKAATPSPDADTLAEQWVTFIETNLPAYDGISFDLEGVSGPNNPAPTDPTLTRAKQNAAAFYRAFARRLSKSEIAKRNASSGVLAYDHIVAFASGNLIGEIDTPGMKSSRRLKHAEQDDPGKNIKKGELARDTTGNFISKFPPLAAQFWEKAQDYSLGKGLPNLLIRTMSYDNFKKGDPPEPLDDWHADLVRAFGTMPDVSFQLGVKTINGPGQGPPLNMDGVMGGVAHVEKRCTDLLHPNNVGLSFFPQSTSFWNAANAALNPTVPEAGTTPGMPKQAPLDAVAISALKKTRKTTP